MADEQTNRDSFRIQAGYCTAMAAPITARISTVLGKHLRRDSETGRRVLDWPGAPDALNDSMHVVPPEIERRCPRGAG